MDDLETILPIIKKSHTKLNKKRYSVSRKGMSRYKNSPIEDPRSYQNETKKGRDGINYISTQDKKGRWYWKKHIKYEIGPLETDNSGKSDTPPNKVTTIRSQPVFSSNIRQLNDSLISSEPTKSRSKFWGLFD